MEAKAIYTKNETKINLKISQYPPILFGKTLNQKIIVENHGIT